MGSKSRTTAERGECYASQCWLTLWDPWKTVHPESAPRLRPANLGKTCPRLGGDLRPPDAAPVAAHLRKPSRQKPSENYHNPYGVSRGFGLPFRTFGLCTRPPNTLRLHCRLALRRPGAISPRAGCNRCGYGENRPGRQSRRNRQEYNVKYALRSESGLHAADADRPAPQSERG